MDNKLNARYWEQRYREDNTPWDIGGGSPAIQHYMDQIDNQELRILIPGAGLAHDAIALFRKGFTQVFVCDWAVSAFEQLKKQSPDFPENHLIVADFFELDMEVDLILEQTFFCAISPSQRAAYVNKSAELLSSNGKLAGLLFAQPFPTAGPPFGGTKEEYTSLFSTRFDILKMQIAEHSISPRAGKELFIELIKR